MPTYGFMCNDCKHEYDRFLKMAERDVPLSEPCPACGKNDIGKVFGSNAFLDPVRLGLIKPDDGFRDVLRKIKSNSPKCAYDV
jgi:putative FmdB family regulatory protein